MSSRLMLEPWQLSLLAVGFSIFFGIFAWVLVRVLRMKRPAVNHLETLPLQDENAHSAAHVRHD